MKNNLFLTFCLLTIIIACEQSSNKKSNSEQSSDKSSQVSKEVLDSFEHQKIDTLSSSEYHNSNATNYAKKAEEFVEQILGDDLKIYEFNKIPKPYFKKGHLSCFSEEGFRRGLGYYDKELKQYHNLNGHESFILYILEYDSVTEAKKSFDQFKWFSQFDYYDLDSLEEPTNSHLRYFLDYSKPGGLITQKGKWIFSLVETCRNAPVGSKWEEYEDIFINYIKEQTSDSLVVLNADCGRLRYIIEVK